MRRSRRRLSSPHPNPSPAKRETTVPGAERKGGASDAILYFPLARSAATTVPGAKRKGEGAGGEGLSCRLLPCLDASPASQRFEFLVRRLGLLARRCSSGARGARGGGARRRRRHDRPR